MHSFNSFGFLHISEDCSLSAPLPSTSGASVTLRSSLTLPLPSSSMYLSVAVNKLSSHRSNGDPDVVCSAGDSDVVFAMMAGNSDVLFDVIAGDSDVVCCVIGKALMQNT